MFLLLGLGTRRKQRGPGATRDCARCRNTTTWERVDQCRQFTLFFVPVLRWRRVRLEVCGICGHSVTL